MQSPAVPNLTEIQSRADKLTVIVDPERKCDRAARLATERERALGQEERSTYEESETRRERERERNNEETEEMYRCSDGEAPRANGRARRFERVPYARYREIAVRRFGPGGGGSEDL